MPRGERPRTLVVIKVTGGNIWNIRIVMIVRKIFCEKVHERLFLAFFAVYTGKKKDFVKKCDIL
jgi:hypothetical protein